MGATEDRIDLSTAERLLDGSQARPVACCPHDGEPLIATLEFAGAEFYCVPCGCTFGFLSPTPADPTPELAARIAELEAEYEGERRLRQATGTEHVQPVKPCEARG